MFKDCFELEYLDLSNFNTSKVTNMVWMFEDCNKLKYLNLLNFSISNCETKNMLNFSSKKSCKFITNNKDLLNLYNSS
jgi:surface protein